MTCGCTRDVPYSSSQTAAARSASVISVSSERWRTSAARIGSPDHRASAMRSRRRRRLLCSERPTTCCRAVRRGSCPAMFVGSILQVTLQFADCTTFRYGPSMNDSPHPLAAHAGLLGLAAIWGVNFSVVKIVFRELDPLALNALRFPLAAAVFWLVLRPRRGPRGPERRDVPRILLLAAIGHVVYQICFVVGLDRTLA